VACTIAMGDGPPDRGRCPVVGVGRATFRPSPPLGGRTSILSRQTLRQALASSFVSLGLVGPAHRGALLSLQTLAWIEGRHHDEVFTTPAGMPGRHCGINRGAIRGRLSPAQTALGTSLVMTTSTHRGFNRINSVRNKSRLERLSFVWLRNVSHEGPRS
jgi:hypothetical protein